MGEHDKWKGVNIKGSKEKIGIKKREKILLKNI